MTAPALRQPLDHQGRRVVGGLPHHGVMDKGSSNVAWPGCDSGKAMLAPAEIKAPEGW